MQSAERTRAVTAARDIARPLGLVADNAVVLHDSNKLTLRLLPCDTVARVAPEAEQVADMEVELALRLTDLGSPVAALDPRVAPTVHLRDGFAVTFWAYYRARPGVVTSPADYAAALEGLHAGMRRIDARTPHMLDRVDSAQRLLATPADTPDLADDDRRLLADTLAGARRLIAASPRPEQLLHGEPHPGNLLDTADGLLFVDLETCCRGPIEFDLAHAPDEVAQHYPGVDPDLLDACRLLMLAMVTTWRWERGDQLPDGRRLAAEWLDQIRAMTTSRP